MYVCRFSREKLLREYNWRMGGSKMLGYVVDILDAMPLIDGFGFGYVDYFSCGLYYSVDACVCV